MQSPISLPISFSFFKLPVQEEYPTVALWKRYSMFRSPAFWSCWVKLRPATAENISVSGWLGGEISVFWKAPKWGKKACIRDFWMLYLTTQIKIIGHIMRDVHRVGPEINVLTREGEGDSQQADLHHLKMSFLCLPPFLHHTTPTFYRFSLFSNSADMTFLEFKVPTGSTQQINNVDCHQLDRSGTAVALLIKFQQIFCYPLNTTSG